MGIAGPIIAVIAVGILIGLFIQARFLLWGASIAKIENRSFGKALGTTILGGIASFVFFMMLSFTPIIRIVGTVIGLVGGLLIATLIMMPIFSTTFGKALGATLLAWLPGVAVIGGIVLPGVALVGGLAALS